MWCDLNKNIWPPEKFIKDIDQIIHQKYTHHQDGGLFI